MKIRIFRKFLMDQKFQWFKKSIELTLTTTSLEHEGSAEKVSMALDIWFCVAFARLIGNRRRPEIFVLTICSVSMSMLKKISSLGSASD